MWERVFNLMLESLPKQMEERPEFVATLGDVRASMARLFHMANEMSQATTHDIISEAEFDCQEMEDVDDDGYDDCADSVDFGGMVDKMADEHHIDRDEAVKRLGAFCRDKRNVCVFMESRSAKTQRQVASAVLTQCRLFGLEGAMTDLAQIRGEVLMPLKRRRGQSLSSLSIPVQSTASMVLLRVRLRSEVRLRVLMLGLERSEQDVIQLSSLPSHGRVVGAPIECALNRVCVGCLWFCMLIPNMPSPVSTDTRVLLSVEWIAGHIEHPWNELAEVSRRC